MTNSQAHSAQSCDVTPACVATSIPSQHYNILIMQMAFWQSSILLLSDNFIITITTCPIYTYVV